MVTTTYPQYPVPAHDHVLKGCCGETFIIDEPSNELFLVDANAPDEFSFPWINPMRQIPWTTELQPGDWLAFAADRATLHGETEFPLFAWALALESQFKYRPRPATHTNNLLVAHIIDRLWPSL